MNGSTFRAPLCNRNPSILTCEN